MRNFVIAFVIVLFTATLLSCGGSRKTAKNTTKGKDNTVINTPEGVMIISGRDTIFYDNRIDVQSASFAKELAGKWNVISMRRQQKAELEPLSGVTLSFDVDKNRFTGKAPCNTINGGIILKGTGMRFQNIISTRMTCDKQEQENYYIKLLNERISAFTVTGDKLYLRDGISNIVFECDRIK